MTLNRTSLAVALAACLAVAQPATADTIISTFDNFNLDGLFAWADATVTSGPTSYTIVDQGYGSGYKDINPNIDATGATHIQLTVTLAGGPSGPIVSLVDGDGTFLNYPWYGTPVGSHVLTAPLSSNPGFADLNLATLDFFHLQDDPGGFTGLYSVEFEDLRLITIPEPATAGIASLGLLGLAALRRRFRA
jgi:hypothetical protein